MIECFYVCVCVYVSTYVNLCKNIHICRLIDKHTNLWSWRRLGTRDTQPYVHYCGQGGFSKCGHKKGRPMSEVRGTVWIQSLPPCAAIWCPLCKRNLCVLISWACVTDMRLAKNNANVCEKNIKCGGVVRYYLVSFGFYLCQACLLLLFFSKDILIEFHLAVLRFTKRVADFIHWQHCIPWHEQGVFFSSNYWIFLRIFEFLLVRAKKRGFRWKNWRVSFFFLGHQMFNS